MTIGQRRRVSARRILVLTALVVGILTAFFAVGTRVPPNSSLTPSSGATRSVQPGASLAFYVTISWTDVYDGLEDTVVFSGPINRVDSAPAAGSFFLTGSGHASGSRPGWLACNPGIEGLPVGSTTAFLSADIRGDTVTFAAYAEGVLAGVLTNGFSVALDQIPSEVPVKPTAEFMPSEPVGDICPRVSYGTLWANRIDPP